jgi:Icc-related predicted phosphoesterase
MRILSIQPEPVVEVRYLNAGRQSGGFYEASLSILQASVDRLPKGVSAILATGDLQGRERFEDSAGGPLRLLGEMLPERLDAEILGGLGLPPAHETGVLLAGDFFTVPALDRRGGTGDVTTVWQAFGERFAWVAGVAGNHDTFGPSPAAAPRFSGNLHYLDGDRVELGGFKIAGIGGIIGNPQRPRRRSVEEYLGRLELLLADDADVLLMHDGPDAPLAGCQGSPLVRQLLERLRPGIVIRGHAHWDQPLVELAGGSQVLNVDARVVILRGGT